jgi:hypothetical protein
MASLPTVDIPRPFPTESFTAWAFRAAKSLNAPDPVRKAVVREQLRVVKEAGYDVVAPAEQVLTQMGQADAEREAASAPKKRRKATKG